MKVALIGGTGALPKAVVESLEAAERPYVLAELEGFGFEGLGARARLSFRLERLASFFAQLKAEAVTHVCFAGAVTRPQIDPSQIETESLGLVQRLGAAMRLGDDGVLREVAAVFFEAGFTLVAAQQVAPDLLPAAGVLGAVVPKSSCADDLLRAKEVHRLMSQGDIGQGCVVAKGQVLAVEALLGTDFMLTSLAGKAADGLFYKAPKLGQERRIDLPVIGPETIALAARAGISTIVIAQGGVMVLGRKEVVAAADAAQIAIEVIE